MHRPMNTLREKRNSEGRLKIAPRTSLVLILLSSSGVVSAQSNAPRTASPEAAAGGPLAYVENGDVISIDVRRKAVDLDVPEAVLAERRKTARSFNPIMATAAAISAPPMVPVSAAAHPRSVRLAQIGT